MTKPLQNALLAAAAALGLTACGLSSPLTQLPQLGQSKVTGLLDAKQKDAALKDMSKLAEEQQKRAELVKPIPPLTTGSTR